MTPPARLITNDDLAALRTEMADLAEAPAGTDTTARWQNFQKRIDALCAALTASPAQDARAALPDLAALIAEMDGIIREMEERNPAA